MKVPQKIDQNASVPPLDLQLAGLLDSGSDCWGSGTCFEGEWSEMEKPKLMIVFFNTIIAPLSNTYNTHRDLMPTMSTKVMK